MATVIEIIKSARPTHWVKNLALFVALFFSGNFLIPELFVITLISVGIFSLAASACYLFNDVTDRNADRHHPIKRKRAVAKGAIPVNIALFISALLATLALFSASFISIFFFWGVMFYIILQVIYTLFLKEIPIIDILSIAAGFILRVWAGAFVINVHLSVWFLLCVVSVALFLAAGKRNAELAIFTSLGIKKRFLYTPETLSSYLSIFATSSWISWALFTFFEPSPQIRTYLVFLPDLPLTLSVIEKWLMVTIPVVIFGVMRYLYIIYMKTWEAESPERTLVKDRPLLTSVIIWVILVFIIIYSGKG